MVVFDSAALDYRMVMVGSLLPWLDLIWDPPAPMHSVLFPTLVMVLVMVLGWGRRLVQRRWLGLAIGIFMHQMLAGSWFDQEMFWWPIFGRGGGSVSVPSPGVAIGMEIVGVVVLGWLWWRLGFADPARRDRLFRTGNLDRSALAESTHRKR